MGWPLVFSELCVDIYPQPPNTCLYSACINPDFWLWVPGLPIVLRNVAVNWEKARLCVGEWGEGLRRLTHSQPLLITGEMLACVAVHLVSWQRDNCYSADVAIFIFQLPRRSRTVIFIHCLFIGKGPVTKITREGFSQTKCLELPR